MALLSKLHVTADYIALPGGGSTAEASITSSKSALRCSSMTALRDWLSSHQDLLPKGGLLWTVLYMVHPHFTLQSIND